MWEKFKESNFAKKCKELSKRGGVVATVLCLVLVLTVALSVSIATNRAKKRFANDTDAPVGTSAREQVTDRAEETEKGTVNAPVHNEENETPVGGEPEEFKLELPVTGVIAKGHDSTIQVWSDTLGAYKVHLGLDITGEKGTPVLAAADGKVAKVWDDALMGKCVAIDHGDEIFTFYKNLDPVLGSGIEEGKELKCGDQIGKIGESAISELADESHLHIEMTVGGIAVDPQDYLSQKAQDAIANAVPSDEGAAEDVGADK
jgi:murein DD-endopeptidase MepM/ murein hydrolase activator NlpD